MAGAEGESQNWKSDSTDPCLAFPRVSGRLLLLLAVAYYGGARLGLLLAMPGTNVGLVYVPVGMMMATTMHYGYRVLSAMLSERNRTEEALRVAHERLANIIECLPDPAFVIGTDRTVIAWNQAMEDLSGVPKEQMLGQGDYAYAVPFFGKRQPVLIDFVETPPAEVDPAYKFIRMVGDKVYAESLLPAVGPCSGAHLWGVAAPLYDRTGARCGAIEVIRDVTDRVETAERLRASDRKARAVFDLSLGFLGLLTPDGTVLEVNRAALDFAGAQLSDVVGRPFWETAWWSHSPEMQARLCSAVQAAAAGKIVRFEATHRMIDGSMHTIDCSLKPVFDEVGHVVMLIPEGRDITERKHAEDALDLERRFFEALFESLPGYAFVLDEDGRYVRCNRNLEQSYGTSLVGTSFMDDQSHVHPAHRERMRRVLQDAFVTGRASAEYTSLLDDGTEVPRFATGQVFVLDGRPYGVGVSFDISERVRAEKDVGRLKNSLANIIDSMPSILVGTGPDEVVTQWNRRAEGATGIPASQAIGQPVGAVLPDFYPWIAGLRGEIEHRRPATMEKALRVEEGQRRFYDLMLYPLAADGTEGAVLRIEDVTERTRIQELMVQAEKMMSVGGLAAGMAHEINNPLGIIAQAAQNIERRVSPALPANQEVAESLGLSLQRVHAYFCQREILQFIRDIREASSRAARIVGNMLGFSRQSESARQPVSLAEVLDRTVELAASDYDLKKRFDFRDIEIVREYEPGLPPVSIVTVEMEQVFLNLLKNAAQAMASNPPARRPQIVLRLRRKDKYVVAEVQDNGPGLDAGVTHRVFEPFFTTKSPDLGTGLGLSVSYVIVTQNHKGLISVESIPGHGARFIVRLPLGTEDAP